MNDQPDSRSFTLEPADNLRLANLCGQFNEHLRLVEERLGVEVNNRGNTFTVLGDSIPVQAAEQVLMQLYADTAQGELKAERVHLLLQETQVHDDAHTGDDKEADKFDVSITTRHGIIKGRGTSQRRYLHNVLTHDINFGVGPAGTGKTYLAVACAVEALEKQTVQRIVLVRPAVEAGERLGFLPGDLAQKVDPYLRPLYDALYEMLGFERVDKLIERNAIEVAPLAYMRGRTLNDSYIILDEAQNTTVEQMKMFLTRIGFGSTAVVTGDVTQVDLPKNTRSGLRHVVEVLKDVKGVSFTFFKARDVVRHPLVQKVVVAYEAYEKTESSAEPKGN
ncbi:Phosphate starvation-inducible protein PhoH, predicted ATPase [hydrothermal vent metagenome]|uniref:PhoH-like protein n=1 Tax=hydrothermal vent metagenome TaxID=652676 RepID=A0A3B1BFG9_9ZZZZ